MASNEKNFKVKLGITTPKADFIDSTGDVITAELLSLANPTLSFEGINGQLLSIADSMTGTIFSVNDVSGIPSIEVNSSGVISLAEYSGSVGIGTSSPTEMLDVKGNLLVTGDTTVTGKATINTGWGGTNNIGLAIGTVGSSNYGGLYLNAPAGYANWLEVLAVGGSYVYYVDNGGGVYAASLNASGSTTIGSTLSVTGATTLSGGTSTTTMDASGNSTIGGTLAVTGNSTLTGDTSIGGTLSVTGVSTVNKLNILANNDITLLASYINPADPGDLVFADDIGTEIARIYMTGGKTNLRYGGTGGGPIAISDSLTQTNLNADMLDGLHSTSFLSSSGGTISGNLNVTGSTTLAGVTASGTLVVTGASTFNGGTSTTTLSVTGASTLGADATFNKQIVINQYNAGIQFATGAFGGSGNTQWWHGPTGAGDNVLSIVRNGISSYDFTMYGGLNILNNADLTLSADSVSPTDPGDLVFADNAGTELARIYKVGNNIHLRYNGVGGGPINNSAGGVRFTTGSASGPYYSLIQKLPASNGSTYDELHVILHGSTWTSNTTEKHFSFRNRAGFRGWYWSINGVAGDNYSTCVAYLQTDGSVDIYLKLGSNSYTQTMVRAFYNGGSSAGGTDSFYVTDFSTLTTTVPTGTLVWNNNTPNATMYMGTLEVSNTLIIPIK